MYRKLDPEKVEQTIFELVERIGYRFPGSGLEKVCHELLAVSQETRQRSEWIGKPNLPLRIATAVVVVLIVVVIVEALLAISWQGKFGIGEVVPVIEAGLNVLVLVGAAIFFLLTVEARIKRKRALEAMDELRALAHVVDMHQLTKDPGLLTREDAGRQMSTMQLTRYLDYCTEALSLIGKAAALYAQHFNDEVVLAAVNEIESLTSGLSRKIWQKIMILQGGGLASAGSSGGPTSSHM